MLKILLITMTFSLSAIAKQGKVEDKFIQKGQDGSGGGYQYRETSLRHLNETLPRIIRALKFVDQAVLNEITSKYTQIQIPIDELQEVVENIKLAPLEVRSRLNSDGYEMPLIMDYTQNPKSIIALKPFFEKFDYKTDRFYTYLDENSNPELSPRRMRERMSRLIIHEASHTFGIGINNDEVSYELSLDIMVYIREWIHSYFDCGLAGTIEERIAGCNRFGSYYKQVGLKRAVITSRKNHEGDYNLGAPYDYTSLIDFRQTLER